ncbi:7347_t:CDS:2 [Entrophospora sp. SA101]|nr:7347_t:CDS:2 [Entrophospora sp. SA101]
MYKDKDNWEQVWYKLRGVSLELFRTTRGNAIRRIKSSLFQKFQNLEEINNDATINQILEWKDNDSTKEALDSLCEIEEDDDMTFFENITREAFAGDRGKVNGTNKSFVWAILNAFLGTENNSLHLGEKMIVPLMAKYESENVDHDVCK